MDDFQGTKYITLGSGDKVLFWGHGWGQSHAAFHDLAVPLKTMGVHTLIDFPGFGESDTPPEDWGTADYADHIADFIRSHGPKKIIWVGHSFGCRVGLQLAARHPDLIAGLFLIAGAGLPRKRPLWQKLYFKLRIAAYKILKKLTPFGLPQDWLVRKFGSADYQNANQAIRKIFVRVVNEDLSDIARNISCPVQLIYGENDTETPPEIGKRLNTLIPNSELIVLQGQDHYSVLGTGRHQVVTALKTFIQKTHKG